MGDELRARRVKRLAKNDPRFKHLPNAVAEHFANFEEFEREVATEFDKHFAEIPPPEGMEVIQTSKGLTRYTDHPELIQRCCRDMTPQEAGGLTLQRVVAQELGGDYSLHAVQITGANGGEAFELDADSTVELARALLQLANQTSER